MNENLSGLVSGLQQKADAVAASVKEQLENVVGEETVAKVADVLNTDVGAMAQESVEQAETALGDLKDKATDALEKLTHKDLDGDGDIAGQPQSPQSSEPPEA
jgi:predicted transcriptional regulator